MGWRLVRPLYLSVLPFVLLLYVCLSILITVNAIHCSVLFSKAHNIVMWRLGPVV
jgi:hypothetical protein